MLKLNKKVSLQSRLTAITAESCLTLGSVLKNIIELDHSCYTRHHRSGNHSILVVTGDHLFSTAISDFPCFNAEKQRAREDIDKHLDIDAHIERVVQIVHYSEFEECRYSGEYPAVLGDTYFTTVICGPINNIPDAIVAILRNMFKFQEIYVFGDDVIRSPEFNNYALRFLDNASHDLVPTYGIEDKVSPHKKINLTLSKLRDKNVTDIMNISTQAPYVTKEQSDVIDINDIKDSLDIDPFLNVVVPRHIAPIINSELYLLTTGRSTISIQPGDILYTRMPFSVNLNGKTLAIPVGSKIKIGPIIEDLEREDESGRILKFIPIIYIKIDEETGEEVDINIGDCAVDFTSYLLAFDPGRQPLDIELYEKTIIHDDLFFDFDILYLVPFRVFTPIEQKYLTSKRLRAYIETIMMDASFPNSWYQSASSAVNELHIIHDTTFTIKDY